MSEVWQVVTTIDSEAKAQALVDQLVTERLAACGQVCGPITSTYRWQGEVKIAREWVVTLKTTDDVYERLEAAIRASHSYKTPEILAFAAASGYNRYIEWLSSEVSNS